MNHSSRHDIEIFVAMHSRSKLVESSSHHHVVVPGHVKRHRVSTLWIQQQRSVLSWNDKLIVGGVVTGFVRFRQHAFHKTYHFDLRAHVVPLNKILPRQQMWTHSHPHLSPWYRATCFLLDVLLVARCVVHVQRQQTNAGSTIVTAQHVHLHADRLEHLVAENVGVTVTDALHCRQILACPLDEVGRT